jgi:hypothetical protein
MGSIMPTMYLWKSVQIIGCFLVSGALFILLGFQQAYAALTTNERRIFPVEFLKSRTMVLLFRSMSCVCIGLVIPLYTVPLFFQFTRSDVALDAALPLSPFVFVSVFACLSNGAIMSEYSYALVFGCQHLHDRRRYSNVIVSENTSTSQNIWVHHFA